MERSLTEEGKASSKFLSKKWKSCLKSHRRTDYSDKRYLEELRKLHDLACQWEAGIPNEVLYISSRTPSHTKTYEKRNCAVPLSKSSAENSSTAQTVSNKDSSTKPLFSNADASCSSNYESDSASTRQISHTEISDECTKIVRAKLVKVTHNRSPLSTSSAESSTSAKTVPSKDSSTQPSVSSTDASSPSVISNSESDFLTRISDDDSSSLQVVSSTVHDSSTNSVISKDPSSILPTASTAAKDTSPMQSVLPNQCSVGTQVNFIPTRAKPLKLAALRNKHNLRGRRIVSFAYIFQALKSLNNHNEAGCSINNMIITSEKRSGLFSSFILKCAVCEFEKEIYSENPCNRKRINTDFVSAMLDIKCSFQDVDLLLKRMNMPLLSQADFIEESKIISTAEIDIKNSNQNPSTNLRISVQERNQLNVIEQRSATKEKTQKVSQLTANPQSIAPKENKQKKSHMSAMQQYSPAREDVQKVTQLNVVEQCHATKESGEKVYQLTASPQGISTKESKQKRSQISAMQQCSIATEDVKNVSQLSNTQQCSSITENPQKESQLSGLLIKDHFEIEVDDDSEDGNESETTILDQDKRAFHNTSFADRERGMLNTTIKKEITSDGKNFTLPLTKETIKKEKVTENKKQTSFRSVLPRQNEAACVNKELVNQEQINLQKNIMVEDKKSILVKPQIHDVEIVDEDDISNSTKKPESELPLKKARIVACKDSNISTSTQGIQGTGPSKEISTIQFQPNRNSSLIASQKSYNVESGTSQGVSGTKLMSIPQPASQQLAYSSYGVSNSTDVTFALPTSTVQHLSTPLYSQPCWILIKPVQNVTGSTCNIIDSSQGKDVANNNSEFKQ